jgi:hypothetical protein
LSWFTISTAMRFCLTGVKAMTSFLK